jgi:hypothetical protein
MDRATARKLKEIVDRAAEIDAWGDFRNWCARASSYVETTLGEAAKIQLDTLSVLGDDRWSETLALRRGYLEGLIALAESEMGEVSSVTDGHSPQSKRLQSRKVFVVHGHDDAAKTYVALFLQRVGLEPIILHERPNAGRTIIEKFEVYSDDIAFAVVLLTPDDVGSEAGDPWEDLKPRARQNVILELGFFIGTLGRTRVCALHKGNVELPSDYQGVLYVEMDAPGAWKTKLAQELVASKITINIEAILGA